MFGFWKYDLFPFLLGGEITKTKIHDSKKCVESKEYGIGYYFLLDFSTSNKKGRKLLKELNILKTERLEEISTLDKKYKKKLKIILKESRK